MISAVEVRKNVSAEAPEPDQERRKRRAPSQGRGDHAAHGEQGYHRGPGDAAGYHGRTVANARLGLGRQWGRAHRTSSMGMGTPFSCPVSEVNCTGRVVCGIAYADQVADLLLS